MRLRWLSVAVLLLVSGLVVSSTSYAGGRVASQQREISFVVHKLELHPVLAAPAKRRAFLAVADAALYKAATPLPDWRIVAIEDRLTAWFRDPHTAAYPFAAAYSGSHELPLEFYWSADGLVVLRLPDTPEGIHTGDRVLAFSGVSTRSVERRLAGLIAGDAIFRRQLGSLYLQTDSTLRSLGLVLPDGRVALRLQRADGTAFTAALPLLPTDKGSFATDGQALTRFYAAYLLPDRLLMHGHVNSTWAWAVTPHYGFFLLESCVYDASYQQAVSAFFRQVAREGSPVVVLDLQENGGGDSDVVIPWLEHLPFKYEASDVRLGTSAGFAPDLPQVAPIFGGRLYVLQSGGTFSSAMWLADALTGPGLGVRVGSAIGEPTGGWGNVAEYVTPVLHIPFQVSKQYMAPIKGSLQATLPAQIPLPLTPKDIQRGLNPVARWLATLP